MKQHLLSIRRLATVAALFFFALALVATATLVGTSSLLEASLTSVVRDTESRALVNEAELALLTHHRLSNVRSSRGGAQLEQTRAELERQIAAELAAARRYVSSEVEARRLDEAEAHIGQYFDSFSRLREAEGARFELRASVRAALGDAVTSLEALRELNEQQVQEADARALETSRFAKLVGWAAAIIVALGIAVLLTGIHRYLLRPMFEFHRTMARFRSGELEARVLEEGPREIVELAQGFNGMAEVLAQQRKAQLAFLGGVAHDLRNPLNALRLGLELMQTSSSEPVRAKARERLDRQVGYLERMVRDLLDQARIESGQLELRTEELDLASLTQSAVDFYEPAAPEHQLRLEIPKQPVLVCGDAARLQQVITNLLSNAVKFSPRGGEVLVRVRVEGGRAALSVTDHGIGIPEHEHGELFMPFRRKRPDVADGTGLGLSVVRRIVEAQSGRIELVSRVDEGSTFTVWLPLVAAEPPRVPHALLREARES